MNKVKVAAIIAEFNPLHRGHEYIIKRARELTECTHVLIIQSGNFTQRAVPAILEIHSRAETAIRAGADAVVEIPAAFATGNAEVFAKAAVKIAVSFPHVNYLVFGTESKDISVIRAIATAQVKREKEFTKYMDGHLKKGISFDKARTEVIKRMLPKIPSEVIEATMTSSNNILGIEYLKELTRIGGGVVPMGVQRIQAPSASQIREVMLATHGVAGGGDEPGLVLRRPSALSYLTRENFDAFGSAVLFSIMTRLDEEVYNSNEEIVGLIRNLHPTTYKQLKEEAPTKRFAVSRIARLALHSALGVTKRHIAFLYKNEWVPYTNLLAISTQADNLFSALCLNSRTPMVVRGNKIKPKLSAYYRALIEIDERARLLYEAIWGRAVERKPRFVNRSIVPGQRKIELPD
ncbi:MAG: nucleotidyltransferase family protein [Firmicutes bacterium]|nr:nucleotidyltransferase family protein [Bacillota bacterium]